ncbi:MAG TPA: AmmeMemoRadiSam system radical SAM enzyme, partial [Candidatus Binatia bacterium]
IKYCYVGNVYDDEGQTTYCPACERRLIRRSWHDILEYNLNGDRCPCGEPIPGRFLPIRTSSDARRLRSGVAIH